MRGAQMVRILPLLFPLTLVACDRGDAVARVGNFTLGVEEVVDLLAPAANLPNDSSLIQAVADFWTDYTALTWVLNEPGEMDRIDLSVLTDQERSRVLVSRLRDAVIQVDSVISDEELRALYEETGPADQVRARHILLGFPDAVTNPQRDSVRTLANQIRDRARGGENFAAMAAEYSADPGSAPNGGDLGFFGRGMMVPSFDSASFALPIGEVSDPVESEFGLHIILVEERQSPAFEELPFDFRAQVLFERTTAAENAFLDQLIARSNVQVAEGAVARIREITRDPNAPLSGSEGRQVLVTYEGGSYTASDYVGFVLSQPVELRGQVEMALDEQLDTFLHDLVRDRLLIQEAESQGITMTALELQQAELGIKTQLQGLGTSLGLASVQLGDASNLEEAIQRDVMAFLERVVAGTQELLPLGPLAVPLRTHYSAEFSGEAIQLAVTRIDEERRAMEAGSAPPAGIAPPAETAPTEPAPTTEAPPAPGAGN